MQFLSGAVRADAASSPSHLTWSLLLLTFRSSSSASLLFVHHFQCIVSRAPTAWRCPWTYTTCLLLFLTAWMNVLLNHPTVVWVNKVQGRSVSQSVLSLCIYMKKKVPKVLYMQWNVYEVLVAILPTVYFISVKPGPVLLNTMMM